MDRNRDKKAEMMLHLTLEILFRLTGEDYTVVKKTSSERCQAPVSEEWAWIRPLSPITDPPPHPVKHEDINDQKILQLAYKMIELLTGEVPIKCDDVAVYFSMEEWEYLEGHKDLYKDVMMEVTQPLTSPDDCTRNSEELTDFKADDHVNSPDAYEEHAPILDIPSVLHSKNQPFDFFQHILTPISLQTVQNENFRRNVEHPMVDAEKPFSCSECKKRFKLKSSLVIHQRIHTTERVFSCRECLKCFNQKADLIIHAISHTGENPFFCSECGKYFPLLEDFVKHKKTHTDDKLFTCPECGTCFTYRGAIRHKRTHTGDKPLQCPECGKCFTQEAWLIEHQRIRTWEKPFSCSECGKCFSQKSHLVAHERIHTREKLFSCSKCWKCFSCKATLLVHLRTHTGEEQLSNLRM